MHHPATKSLAVWLTLVLVAWLAAGRPPAVADDEVRRAVDAYIDGRFEAPAGATNKLLKQLANAGLTDPKALETALRDRRADYPDSQPLVGKMSAHKVTCYHVDYESKFLLYVPAGYRADRPLALVVVGHGGNSSMSPARAEQTAKIYLQIYGPPLGKQFNCLVAAPVSSRGWGNIGNSLILSTISKLTRRFPIDPDRIYITGQSMGGHMAYRAALSLSDRFGAVSPHSGGYDFVAKQSIGNLLSVPGYAIWGIREPYGINKDNRTNAAWGKARKIDWKFVEKNGGHTIYRDELPKVAEFFEKHPRDLYRPTVYLRLGGAMKFVRTWQVKTWPKHSVYSDRRPLRWNVRHWVEVEPRPDVKEPLELLARNQGDNQLDIRCRNVRSLRVLLHPRLVDLSKPVRVTVNGKPAVTKLVKPDTRLMFETAREFDDRGRVYWAALPLEVTTDADEILESPDKPVEE